MELTCRQKNTLDFIKNYISKNLLSPTSEEIAKGINIASRGVVYRYLKALKDKGYIELINNQKRNIRLVEKDDNTKSLITLPYFGKIAAGKALDSTSHMEQIDLSRTFSSENTNSSSKVELIFLTNSLLKAFEVSDLIIQFFKNVHPPISTSFFGGMNSFQIEFSKSSVTSILKSSAFSLLCL